MADALDCTCKTRRRWFRLTPDRCVLGLLAVEGFLLLSAWFQWFAFNQHKGWSVLICLATVGAAFVLMLLWFLAALVFRWRFQFGILALLLLVVVVAVPFSWLATEMKAAREQKTAAEEIGKLGGHAYLRLPTRFVPTHTMPSRPSQRGCGGCWGMICSSP